MNVTRRERVRREIRTVRKNFLPTIRDQLEAIEATLRSIDGKLAEAEERIDEAAPAREGKANT